MAYIKVECNVPEEYVAPIVKALNEDQLIQSGEYDYCFAYAPVKGYFRPIGDADPFIGEVGEMTQVEEVKLEFRIPADKRKLAERLIAENHPYEVPIINFIALL